MSHSDIKRLNFRLNLKLKDLYYYIYTIYVLNSNVATTTKHDGHTFVNCDRKTTYNEFLIFLNLKILIGVQACALYKPCLFSLVVLVIALVTT